MNKEEDLGIQILAFLFAVMLIALSFQYNVFTLCGKDVSFFLDLLAGLLILWPKFGEVRFLVAINFLTFIVCVIGRFILDYSTPWIK